MAWQNPGLVAINQNYLLPTEFVVDPVSSNAQVGYEHINVMNYTPSRPMKFDSATSTEKRIRFIALASCQLTAIAIIEPHSNAALSVPGDVHVEQQLQFKLTYQLSGVSTLVFDYTPGGGLSASQMDNWGTSFYRSFSAITVTSGSWIELGVRQNVGSIGPTSIGPVILGKQFTFPSNPLITYNRSVSTSSVFTGRDRGAVTVALRDPAQRTIDIRVRATDEDARIQLERYLAGRGRNRAGGGSGNEMARKRLDLPTALVSPDMWFDASATYGGCIFGRFIGGMVSQSYVGGAAMVDLQFQEMV
jgi:hypothetical protein